MGINKKYCIMRVLPVDTQDLSFATKKSITTNPQVIKVYDAIVKKVLSKKKTKLILTFGSLSGTLIDHLTTAEITVLKLKAWSQSGAKGDWQNALTTIQNKNYAKDISHPSFSYDGERLQIPGYDLPYGTLKWQASSGDRAKRALLSNDHMSPDYYKLIIPDWAYKLKPLPLTSKEQAALMHHP